jgi:RNA polymerase sigma factor (sigma-70 family)
VTLTEAPERQESISLAAMLGQYETAPLANLPDGPLLRYFLTHRVETAFTVMVRRHGPMVRRVCQRMLGASHDADDAFQATFLVLVRRAAAIQPPEMLGPWLHGVACRCALSIRQQRGKRASRELPFEETQIVNESPVEFRDWLPYLDEAIQQLPERYRRPVVLCELEGRSRSEAATMLGIAEGTLSSRLASARKKLAARLRKRGLLSVAVLSSWAAWESSASAALPESLVNSTIGMGMNLIERTAVAVVPPQIAAASHGALTSMFMSKCKTLAMVSASVGCLGYGCWLAGDLGAMEAPRGPAIALLQPADDTTAPDDQRPAQQGSVNTTRGQRNAGASSPAREQHTGSKGQHSGTVNTTSGQHGTDWDDKHADHKKHQDKHHKTETLVGSGKLETETRAIKGVKGLELRNAGKITIKVGDKESLTLTTDDNLLPVLTSDVINGTLVLDNKNHTVLQTKHGMTYVIEVKALDRLSVLGAGAITVQGLNNDKTELTIAGAGTITLDGSSDQLNIKVPGSGDIKAGKLQVHAASINIGGSGSVSVNASDKLSVTINGSGSIEYSGNPVVTKSINGSGSVRKKTSVVKE